ncbi:PHA/PHB synthase family protein [Nocardioides albidus]|nr:alpha/beta fold hydrolase [Nocardioides albidus]
MSDDTRVNNSAGAGFEAVVTAAASRGLGGLLPPEELRTLARALAGDPSVALDRLSALMAEHADIASRKGDVGGLDARFADPAWHDNPLLNMVARSYVASSEAVLDILDEVDVDWRTRERLRMPVDNLLAALAPTNNPLLNPAGWKEALDTGGASILRGFANFARDMSGPTKLPSSVDRADFVLGETIAATPGKVVRRERLYELIEYLPQTEEVDAVPVLLTPSPVNKYYLVDLEPEHSIVAAHLREGRRVFVPSWVQPDASHADVGFEAYVASLVEALESVAEISGSERVHLLGLCGGGQVALMTAAYLAAVDRQDLLATLTLGIAVVDFDEAHTMAFLDEETGERAVAQARERGVFSAADTARSFAMMRPAEGIWSGVVNNYVMGRRPPKLALLYWASDQTNMTAQFGSDMIGTALANGLTKPGGVTILGQPLDTRQITVDTYVLGASTDHISPWKHCFRTLAMVGGERTFVLAGGGHAIAISRPPEHRKSMHWTGEITGTDPDAWLEAAEKHAGSWWRHWSEWISTRTPDKVPAPTEPGSAAYPPLCDAPGEYVRVVLT